MKRLEAANTASGGPNRPESGAYAATLQGDSKHVSMATTMTGSPMIQQQQGHGFGPAFGYTAPEVQHPIDPYGNSQAYGIHPISFHQGQGQGGYPMFPQSQSPPPPLYPSSSPPPQGYYKEQPAEVAGDEVHHPAPMRIGTGMSSGMSDTYSQVTSNTAVGSSYAGGGEGKPPAELSSLGSRG